jgi:hypothetical protein
MIAPYQSEPAVGLPLDNRQIADRLEEVAELLDERHDNPFRARAYRSAAETIRGLSHPVSEILKTAGWEGLTELPGVGSVLARVIEQLARTGELALLDELRGESDPEELLASVPGVGPGLARRIHDRLGVRTLEDLERAAHDGRLAEVPGLGPKRIQGIRETLAGRFNRRRLPPSPLSPTPPVEELLEVDQTYRERAAAGVLHRIAPRRFNPAGEAWLPVLRLRRGPRVYRALYSNTAQAHRLGKTRDWVVLYVEKDGRRGRWTVVTASSGPMKGRRVVRGREAECMEYYRRQPAKPDDESRPGE